MNAAWNSSRLPPKLRLQKKNTALQFSVHNHGKTRICQMQARDKHKENWKGKKQREERQFFPHKMQRSTGDNAEARNDRGSFNGICKLRMNRGTRFIF